MAVARGEPGEALLRLHDPPPVLDHRTELPEKATTLVGLAAVERHPLGVFAEANQTKAEVGFEALLVEVQPHERAPDLRRDPRADQRVHEGDVDHVARDRPVVSAEAELEHTGEAVQDRDERDQVHRLAQEAEAEAQGQHDERLDVLRDALVRVVGAAVDELHLVVGPALEPAIETVLRQPASPPDLEHLVQIELLDGGNDESRGEPTEDRKLMPECRQVLVLDRVVEGCSPQVE